MGEIKRQGDRAIVKPEQDIVSSMVGEFRKELKSLLDEEPGEVVFDLEGVTMIDSVGLGALIATYNSLSKTGGKMKVVNASADLCGLFKTTRLDKHFEVKGA